MLKWFLKFCSKLFGIVSIILATKLWIKKIGMISDDNKKLDFHKIRFYATCHLHVAALM